MYANGDRSSAVLSMLPERLEPHTFTQHGLLLLIKTTLIGKAEE